MNVLILLATDPVASLDPQHLIPFVVGVVIPLLTAVLTKWNAASGLKAVVTLALSAVGSALTAVNVTSWADWSWQIFAVHFAFTFVSAIAAYQGAWKPTRVAPALALATPGGLGRPPMEADAPHPPGER